jgi:alpha-beta hydrolase superfamily lysophospholipase
MLFMKQYYLAEIITKDNLIHQGIYFEPKQKSDIALLWVHGLSSNFYFGFGLYEFLIDEISGLNFGFASFNTRGHDSIAGLKKKDASNEKGYLRVLGGAGYEIFSDCKYDIDAGISFLIKQGYKKIILCGHSTGANKVCYYSGLKIDQRIAGVILTSPTSDRLSLAKTDKKIQINIRRMKHMVEKGKGDFLVNNLTFMPLTPKRYISLYDKNTCEDVFDYGDKHPKLKYFGNIDQPLLVLMGENDETVDRPVMDIQKVFDKHHKSKNYNSVIIPGATHGFDGKEKEFAETIIDWIKTITV